MVSDVVGVTVLLDDSVWLAECVGVSVPLKVLLDVAVTVTEGVEVSLEVAVIVGVGVTVSSNTPVAPFFKQGEVLQALEQ